MSESEYIRKLETENAELKAELRRLKAENRDKAREIMSIGHLLMRKAS